VISLLVFNPVLIFVSDIPCSKRLMRRLAVFENISDNKSRDTTQNPYMSKTHEILLPVIGMDPVTMSDMDRWLFSSRTLFTTNLKSSINQSLVMYGGIKTITAEVIVNF
jgi:hypothetical protein